jgi:hypothetical protein
MISTPKPSRAARVRWWHIVLASCVALIAGVFLAARPLARLAERRLYAALQQVHDGQLEVKSVKVSLFPRVVVDLDGITLHRSDAGGELRISILKASASTGYWDLLRRPVHIRKVLLQQLEIHVPPRRENGPPLSKSDAAANSPHFVIDEVVADGTTLEVLPKKADKQPLEFDIRHLTLNEVRPETPMKFRAILTNAKPPGDIHSSGTFGPWQMDDPGLTPVQGTYLFQNADLAVFKGIAGTLSSEGIYQGVLDRICAEGHTDTPDFTVQVGGNPVHLVTQFQAVIDGLNGDTRLDPVNGQFGHTSLIARGVVQGTRGAQGKTVVLDVEVDQGRLEDLLRLGVKGSNPPLSGAIAFRTKLVIPPGPVMIPEKLLLNGQFSAGEARFDKFSIQQRVDKLSAKGRGEADAPQEPDVASNFRGRFALNAGVMSLDQLSFRVPGVQVGLHGTYGLIDEKMDLHGAAQLDVKLSQTASGFKSFLLKALDPLFSKNGKDTVLPIHIGGTRSEPSFGLDLKKGTSAKSEPYRSSALNKHSD